MGRAGHIWGHPGYPPTRLTRWRITSPTCAFIDALIGLSGTVLFVLAALDAVVSWPADRVLLTEPHLDWAGAALTSLGGVWWVLSAGMVFGNSGQRQRRRRVDEVARWIEDNERDVGRRIGNLMWSGRLVRTIVGVIAVVCVAVVTGDLLAGAAKGSARILPGPLYEISTSDLNDSAWTVVSPDQYGAYQARFVRLAATFLTAFGGLLLISSVGFLRLHRVAAQEPPGRAVRGRRLKE